MRQLIILSFVILSISLSFCSGKRGKAKQLTSEDSMRIKSERAFQMRLIELQNFRQNLVGPVATGDPSVTIGVKFSTNLLGDSIKAITSEFEKINAKLERAQKDSATAYGALLTRFKLLNTQQKYLTAMYSNSAKLLRFTSVITLDDKHEEDRDYYFVNDTLVYLRVKRTFSEEEQDVMTDDSYFMKNNRVVYSYRDEGSAPEHRNRMDVIPLKRYYLKGNIAGHVSKEFDDFKHEYDLILSRPLEPLIYP